MDHEPGSTRREVQNFSADGREIYGLAISPDSRLLALGLQDGEVDVWDIAQHQRVWQLKGHAGLVVRLAFSSDSSRLASAAFDSYAKLWDVSSGQELFTLFPQLQGAYP